MVIDLDSSVCEAHGKHMKGADYLYARVLGYHPLVAVSPSPARSPTPACARRPLSRGAKRFGEELIALVRPAGATGCLVVPADSGSFSSDLIDTFTRLGVARSVTILLQSPARGGCAGHRRVGEGRHLRPDAGSPRRRDCLMPRGFQAQVALGSNSVRSPGAWRSDASDPFCLSLNFRPCCRPSSPVDGLRSIVNRRFVSPG
jgi:hypothetical protein